jgi:hypothetical protein
MSLMMSSASRAASCFFDSCSVAGIAMEVSAACEGSDGISVGGWRRQVFRMVWICRSTPRLREYNSTLRTPFTAW